MKVILIDDEKSMLLMMRKMLSKISEIEVSGTFQDAASAFEFIRDHGADMAFVDISMPVESGLELTQRISAVHPELAIVFLTSHREYAIEAFRVNAIDYLLKPISAEELNRVIAKVQRRRSISSKPLFEENLSRALLFGGFEVYGQNTDSPLHWPTAKSEELYACLLLWKNAEMSKWKLFELVFPGYDPEKLESNLHSAVYRMRKTLEKGDIKVRLTSGHNGYRLEDGGVPTDYEEFCILAGQPDNILIQDLERLQQAVALYKGELFAGRDWPWCEPERERLEKQYSRLAKILSGEYLDKGDAQKAVEVLTRMLGISPFDEEGHYLLLEAYGKLKDRYSVISHYEKLNGLFRKELGVEPDRNIKKLYYKLLGDK